MPSERIAKEIIHDMMNRIQSVTGEREEQLALMATVVELMGDYVHDLSANHCSTAK